MTGQSTYSRNCKLIAGAVIVGFVVAALLCEFNAPAQARNLLEGTAWAVLEVLRSIIMLADWRAMPGSLCEDSRFWQHLVQIGVAVWPLLYAISG
ncbi:MAG: hypothetical protein ACRD4S_16340 [Candidatus Acidiferrales bacterium]